MKRHLLAIAVLGASLACGCVETRFEAPLGGDASNCDTRWKGLWSSADPGDRSAAIHVDAQCRMIMIDQPDPHRPPRRIDLPVRYAHVGDRDYLSIEAAALKPLVDVPPVHGIHPPPAHAWYFARYTIDGDRLELDPVDSERLGQLVLAGKLNGTVSKTTNELHVFVQGDTSRMRDLVRNQPVFDASKATRLVRLSASIADFERQLRTAAGKQHDDG
jgi:hypothetical protein